VATHTSPKTTIDSNFGDEGQKPTPWPEAVEALKRAEGYLVTTVRPDGRPHQTPLIAVWLDGAIYFCTGPEEQKAKNIASNPQVLLSAGSQKWDQGFDIVVEGEARRVTDEALLQRLADAWLAKYGPQWEWEVRDHGFVGADHGRPWVFEVAPRKVIGFKKGPFSQTTWKF
jgi:general stress protein 26